MTWRCPIAGAMGAEIEGVDLPAPLGNALFWKPRGLPGDQVLVLHDQTLDVSQNKAVAALGPLVPYPFVGTTDHPEVFEIRKEPDEEKNFGGAWLQICPSTPPPIATMLAHEVPSR